MAAVSCPCCGRSLEDLPASAVYCPRCGTRIGDGDRLNPEQQQAVSHLHGPLAVIAGAGSGKTRVIEYRVLALVRSGVEPERILLLTFTRRAAREMLHRASRHDARCRQVHGGTFHSFAWKVVREFADVLRLPPRIAVLDADDALALLGRCMAATPALEIRRPETLAAIYGKAHATGQTIEQVVNGDWPYFADRIGQLVSVHAAYQRAKRQLGLLDFDDLVASLESLLGNDGVRRELGRRYHYVMIDEYQDTTRLEDRIARLLCREHGNLMIVGDDAQSIYGFRGADHRNILEFPRAFASCPVVTLSRNYRSTQAILDVANGILDSMRHAYSKCLVAATGQAGQRPLLVLAEDELSEAFWVVDRIRRNVAQGLPLSRQAVLYRSTYASVSLQTVLNRQAMAYRMVGGLRLSQQPS